MIHLFEKGPKKGSKNLPFHLLLSFNSSLGERPLFHSPLSEDIFYHTDTNDFILISNTNSTQRRIVSVSLNTQRSERGQTNDRMIPFLESGVGILIGVEARYFGEFARNMSCATINNGGVTCSDALTRPYNNNLSNKALNRGRRVKTFGVTSYTATTEITVIYLSNMKSYIVSWSSFADLTMMHLNGTNWIREHLGSKLELHTRL
mmetsp:Transcript_33521/g.45874  ORF Transcript_33521/g.45874 Transcript_33521/m.45874 type:complete len:205 (-) Transcript_33521:793-1407(-)